MDLEIAKVITGTRLGQLKYMKEKANIGGQFTTDHFYLLGLLKIHILFNRSGLAVDYLRGQLDALIAEEKEKNKNT